MHGRSWIHLSQISHTKAFFEPIASPPFQCRVIHGDACSITWHWRAQSVSNNDIELCHPNNFPRINLDANHYLDFQWSHSLHNCPVSWIPLQGRLSSLSFSGRFFKTVGNRFFLRLQQDSFKGVYPRWHIIFNMSMLRLISFNMDFYWSYHSSEKEVCMF